MKKISDMFLYLSAMAATVGMIRRARRSRRMVEPSYAAELKQGVFRHRFFCGFGTQAALRPTTAAIPQREASPILPPAIECQGIGIRYRFRCTVPREKACTLGVGPAATSYASITRAPGSLPIPASDWNPPAGIWGSIRPSRNGTTYVRPLMLDEKYPVIVRKIFGQELERDKPAQSHILSL